MFAQIHTELPLYWFGINRGGTFRYADDNHLCHLTNVPAIELEIYDPCSTPRWRPFDPNGPTYWPGDVPIILRDASLEDRMCVGINHFIEKVQKAVGTSRDIRAQSTRVIESDDH